MEHRNSRWERAQKAEWEAWDRSHIEANSDEIRQRNIDYLCQRTKLDESELKKLRILEIGGRVVEHSFSDPDIPDKYVLDPLFPWDSSSGENTVAMPCIHRIKGMAENIMLPDNSIDLCFCANTIDHTSSPQIVLKEIRRVLINNGLLVISCNLFPSYVKPLIPLFNILDTPHPHHFTLGMFRNLLTNGKFIINNQEGSYITKSSSSNKLKSNMAALFRIKYTFFTCKPTK